MIIVYAGAQADETGRSEPRLPPGAEGDLLTRVRGLLHSLKPRLLIGAAASGSDIIIAETARMEQIEVRLSLPFGVEDFRESSVLIRGERWGLRFDRLLDGIGPAGIGVGQDMPGTESVYLRHNAVLLEEATALAHADERIWVLLVRRPPDPASPSVTDDLAARAEAYGLLTLDLDPVALRPRGFVAMPYGTRFDPVTRRKYDCDSVFHRIYRPLLEDLDVDWTRSDLETDSGIIHVGMIDQLANSELVIADLGTNNFNVAYELGIRHVLARASTVLVYPELLESRNKVIPFDIGFIRIHHFSRGLQLTDLEAERAIRSLRPVLSHVLGSRSGDSPVHEWFELDDVRGPFRRRSGLDGSMAAELRLRQELEAALRSASLEPVRRVAAHLDTETELAESARSGLRLQLGNRFLREAAYAEALEQCAKSEPPAESPLRRTWLQKTAMAHRRIAEASPDPAQRAAHNVAARRVLSAAIQEGYDDSETYGILGGLTKRSLQELAPQSGALETDGRFGLMLDFYRKGFEKDPAYYTGVNLVMALRLALRRGGLGEDSALLRQQLDEALTVSKFMVRLALEADPADPWALMTQAELLLHMSALKGTNALSALRAYSRAAAVAAPDQLESARYQLQFLQRWEGRSEALAQIQQVLRMQGPDQAASEPATQDRTSEVM